MQVLHAGDGVLKDAANGGDKVTVAEGGFDDGAAHVACCAEDLTKYSLV